MDGARIAAVRFNGRGHAVGRGLRARHRHGLRPNRSTSTPSWWGPRAPTGRSLIGRVQTAIAADSLRPDRLRRARLCTNQSHRPFPVLQHAGSRTTWTSSSTPATTSTPTPATTPSTLAEYRAKYAKTGRRRGCARCTARRACTSPGTTTRCFNNWNPETISRRPPRRRAAGLLRAPRHAAQRADPDRLWRSFRWGRTAEVFILDCRSERRPSTRSTNPARLDVHLPRADGLAQVGAARLALRVQVHRQLGAHRRPRRGRQRQLERLRLAAPGDPQPHRQQQPPRRGVALGRRALRRRVPRRGHRALERHLGGHHGPLGRRTATRAPSIRASQWPVLVHGVHNYTLSAPTRRPARSPSTSSTPPATASPTAAGRAGQICGSSAGPSTRSATSTQSSTKERSRYISSAPRPWPMKAAP
jgi:hypothetical protein